MSQSEAQEAIKSLAKQCSSGESLLAMLKHLFGVLSGEAKLGSLAQKTAVLTAVGNCALHYAGQHNNSDMLLKLLQMFGDRLKSEAAEAVVLVALAQLAIWLEHLKFSTLGGNDTTKKVNAFFKTLLDSKATSSSVKNLLFQNMIAIYSSKQLHSTTITIFTNQMNFCCVQANRTR